MDDHKDACSYCLSKSCKGDCSEGKYEPEPPDNADSWEQVNDFIESGFDEGGSAF